MITNLTTQGIHLDPLQLWPDKNLSVYLLRLDKIHPVISGNKWFKLRYYLEQAIAENKKSILTFGGAYSNHLLATAAACAAAGLDSTGIVRGERANTLSPTLEDALQLGMKLHFLSRQDYREKKLPAGIETDTHLLIPEGGYGPPGARGASTICEFIPHDTDYCCCAVGTGTTMAGLLNGLPRSTRVIGISTMKNNAGLEAAIQQLAEPGHNNWELLHDYHFGGYGKKNPRLLSFMQDFFDQTGIVLDFVYTAKLLAATDDLIRRDHFRPGSRIVVIHSGGLQGNRSLP